ncbi:hypothetical protein FA10DRAFT_266696 [Acaromyces ingoldii]|uniref:protein-tyrosine-phosphatase n=1 Tax=Acaromyces ingoldii TaxID=215250 RepID=A0A316YNG8_9BASI|nr:hypothetical protein FA10DRAFT_266696 [Acaromyces ingoldii]PWN90208.1 hypothetical protein FA10DRAFT_266696 [Acaromyces ingoldii]
MEEIIPGLWIGDLACALATDYLSLAGITHIVTAMKQRLPSPMSLPDGRKIERATMHHVAIDDVDEAPILVHLPQAIDFIDEALRQTWLDEGEGIEQGGQWATMGEGTVMVHCQAGVSRSVAIVTAYLMKTRRLSLKEALALVQSRRSQAGPNAGFMHQLELYEAAGCHVDLRNQQIRRFLMSQASILRGDPIEDVLLSYYPTPSHSPAPSSSSSSNSSPLQHGGFLAFSPLDSAVAASSSSGAEEAPKRFKTVSHRSSPAMSRQTSSSGGGGGGGGGNSIAVAMSTTTSSSSTTASTSIKARPRRYSSPTRKRDGIRGIDLSITPSMPPASTFLLDESKSGQSDEVEEEGAKNFRDAFTSILEPFEVMVTKGRGRLPGGVEALRGNEGKSNVGALPKPHYRDRKLRCKMCRRELAARDHVVEHEEGRGQEAFAVRKRGKDEAERQKQLRTAVPGGGRASSVTRSAETLEQKFGAQLRPEQQQQQQQQSPTQTDEEEKTAAQPSSQSNGNARPIQSAASLTSSLPPQLAALRLGRAGGVPTAAAPADASAKADGETKTKEFTEEELLPRSKDASRRMLHSPQCSAYFVEPLAWMQGLQHGEISGRLVCPAPRCGVKLGSWDWAGMQCACGAWVTPAFALHKSKVDEV